MKKLQKNLNHFVLQKLVTYGLHIGSLKAIWNPRFRPFLNGFRNNFCIINPNLTMLYLRPALKILQKTHFANKKILFIGSPVGLEKEFSRLCKQNKHYFIENPTYGFFTNYTNNVYSELSNLPKIEDRPSLIFLFDPSLSSMVFEELRSFDVPVVSFVSTEDDYSQVDYPVPANIKSQKGGLFIFNIFHHLFVMKNLKLLNKEKKLKKKIKAI